MHVKIEPALLDIVRSYLHEKKLFWIFIVFSNFSINRITGVWKSVKFVFWVSFIIAD